MTQVESKFADLPWIALDQPDCYEYGCSQGDATSSKNNEITKDLNFSIQPEIESESFPVTRAFEAFKNAYLDGSKADFSESSISKTNKGYRAVLYDLVAESERQSETLTQRFDRIQLELNQLIQDANVVSEEKSEDKSPEKIKDLKEKAEEFCSYLECSFKSLNVENVTATSRNLLTDSIAKNFEDLKKTYVSSEGDSDEIVLSLLHSVKNEKTYEKERIVELEKKIQHLEALVGNEDLSKFSTLTCGNANASLYEIANRLEAKASLMDQKSISQIESRLVSFNQLLQSIPEKREQIAEADTIKRIGELYETVKKWSNTYETIPTIVDHLISLKAIHEKTSNFSDSLSMLESNQEEIQKKLTDLIDFFQTIHPQFEKQTETIKERMETLSKNLAK